MTSKPRASRARGGGASRARGGGASRARGGGGGAGFHAGGGGGWRVAGTRIGCPHAGHFVCLPANSSLTLKFLTQDGQAKQIMKKTSGKRRCGNRHRHTRRIYRPCNGVVWASRGRAALPPHSLPRRQPPRGASPPQIFCGTPPPTRIN